MINILELRPNPRSKSNGIDSYCNALYKMFISDQRVSVLPVENYPMKRGRFLKERYEKGVLADVISNQNIDVVHINGFASFSVIQSFWEAKKKNKKIVYTAHWHPFSFLNHPFRTRVFFYFILKPLIAKYANVVVTINDDDTFFFKKFHKNVYKFLIGLMLILLIRCIQRKTPGLYYLLAELMIQIKAQSICFISKKESITFNASDLVRAF